jgi:hypothetical protein
LRKQIVSQNFGSGFSHIAANVEVLGAILTVFVWNEHEW